MSDSCNPKNCSLPGCPVGFSRQEYWSIFHLGPKSKFSPSDQVDFTKHKQKLWFLILFYVTNLWRLTCNTVLLVWSEMLILFGENKQI